jgi:DHA2 family methylenomycin A resistance protein-like MFS transporter
MCAGYFLVLLDVTIVNIALPGVRSGLGAQVGDLQWVVDGYAIPLASLMLICGTTGDRYGHKRIVLAGLATFGAASLACGLAPGSSWLIGARVVQGIGAATLLPGTLAITGRTFAARDQQARAIGIWAGIGGLALPAGPLLAGAVIQWLGWRGVFLINLPVIAVALPAVALLAPDDRERAAGRLDLAGAVVTALFLGTTTLAFIEGGRDGFVSPLVACAVFLGAFLLVTLILIERAVPAPMLPPPLFRRPAFAIANVAAATMNLGTLGMLFVLTLYLQSVQDRPSLSAGLAVLPLALPVALMPPVMGRIVGRTGPRAPMAVGLLLGGTGLAGLAIAGVHTRYVELLPVLLTWGIGLGVLTPAVVAGAMSAVPAAQAGLASAANNTARQAGGAIGVAALGAMAGSPSSVHHFLNGMHIAALVAAALFGAMAVLVVAALRRSGVRSHVARATAGREPEPDPDARHR